MSWKIHDEWIDLAQSRHVVIYKNSDTGAEHHLVHDFKIGSCPHCGRMNGEYAGGPVDFAAAKHDTLKQLHAHHAQVMQYRELHPHVRLGNGPKA